MNITKFKNLTVREYGLSCVKFSFEEYTSKDFLLSDCDFIKERRPRACPYTHTINKVRVAQCVIYTNVSFSREGIADTI